MSDQPQAPGWWQASDGRWYPPKVDPRPQPPPLPKSRDEDPFAKAWKWCRTWFWPRFRHLPLWAQIAAVVIVIALLAIAVVTIPKEPGTTAVTAKTPDVAATPTTGGTTVGSSISGASIATTPPTLSSTTTSSRSGSGVVGFGATENDWDSHHRAAQDPPLNPRAVFNPDPSLPQVNGHIGYRYYAVCCFQSRGRATQYEMALNRGTHIDEARALALAELPADAAPLWFAVKDSCAMLAVRSSTLAKAFNDPRIGGGAGQVLVEFDTSQPDGNFAYDPKNIDHLLFLLNNDPTPASAGNC